MSGRRASIRKLSLVGVVVLTGCGDLFAPGRRAGAPRSLERLDGEWTVAIDDVGPSHCAMTDFLLRIVVRDTLVSAKFVPAATDSVGVAALIARFEREGWAPGMISCPALRFQKVMSVPDDMPDELRGSVHGDRVRLESRWAMGPSALLHAEFNLLRAGATLSGDAAFGFAAPGQPVSHGHVSGHRR